MRSIKLDRTEAVFAIICFVIIALSSERTPMITNQKDLRRAFWLDHPEASRSGARHLLHRYARCVRRLCRLMRARRHHFRGFGDTRDLGRLTR